MKITEKKIKVRDLCESYTDDNDGGVYAYNHRLVVRPAYQREFVYKDAKRDAVVDSVRGHFPLGIMYWSKSGDDTYELLDGQQRTISICQFINGDYSINYQFFHNLTDDEKEDLLNYELLIFVCEGTDKEKLEWFKRINIANEQLTAQELRNAVYTGQWLSEAKRYFSKSQCPAFNIADKLMRGSVIRQDYLETAIRWIADKETANGEIEQYMAEHQNDTNANEIWLYFQSVINWVQALFPNYRKEMKGIEWGLLYNNYCNNKYDPAQLESEVAPLMEDEEVTKKTGIYEYMFDRDPRHLSLRTFTDKQKRIAYEKQQGVCPKCGQHFEIEDMQGDHIIPWSQSGKTTQENCQMLCKKCNGIKSDN